MAGIPWRSAAVTIVSRRAAVKLSGMTISPPFASRATSAMAASILPALRTGREIRRTPNEGAASSAARAKNWPPRGAFSGLNRSATRAVRGAISLSSSSHLPLIVHSTLGKPVMLRPGRARLSTKPSPTGSDDCTNTIGMEPVCCWSARVGAVPLAISRSAGMRTNSMAAACMRPTSPLVKRYSTSTSRPTTRLASCKARSKIERHAAPAGSAAATPATTPIRLAGAARWARAASGQAAAPPSNVMNVRRFIRSPRRRARAGTPAHRGRAWLPSAG